MSKRVLEWALSCVRVLHRMHVPKCQVPALVAPSAYAVMIVAFGFGATLASTQAQAAVGRTSGTHSVGNDGSFNYSIPIFTPPGPRGMQPSVALTYNSNDGTGWDSPDSPDTLLT